MLNELITDNRGLYGIVVFFVVLLVAAAYLLAAGSIFGALDDTPITNDPDVAEYNGQAKFDTAENVALIYGPLLLVSGGLVFAVAYYIRRERSGTRRIQ